MSKSLVRAVLVAAVAAGSVLLPAGAASAQKFVLHDEVGDVWSMSSTSETGKPERAGSVRNADLTRMVVAHSDRKVKVWAEYDNLRNVDDLVFFGFGVRTDERVRRDSFVFNISPDEDIVMMSNRRGRPIKCPGLTAEIQWHQDEIEMVVPRSCLSRPDWVQVRAFGSAIRIEEPAEGEEESTFTMFLDAAGKTGWNPNVWSPRLRRG